jgi:hypothetical protein
LEVLPGAPVGGVPEGVVPSGLAGGVVVVVVVLAVAPVVVSVPVAHAATDAEDAATDMARSTAAIFLLAFMK